MGSYNTRTPEGNNIAFRRAGGTFLYGMSNPP